MLEALAILEGAKLARNLNISNIILEDDSMMIIEALTKRDGGIKYLFNIFYEVYLVCNCMSIFIFSWCNRVENEAANFLALLGSTSSFGTKVMFGWSVNGK